MTKTIQKTKPNQLVNKQLKDCFFVSDKLKVSMLFVVHLLNFIRMFAIEVCFLMVFYIVNRLTW